MTEAELSRRQLEARRWFLMGVKKASDLMRDTKFDAEEFKGMTPEQVGNFVRDIFVEALNDIVEEFSLDR